MFVLLPALTVFAQSEQKREDIWISASLETALYNYSGASWGGGLAIGYGNATSIGLKVSWYFISDSVDTLELNFLFRFNLRGAQAVSGPFFQFTGGPALFFPKDDDASLLVELGTISAGLSFGWRFLLNQLIIEPSIRVGYPYIAGAGISVGIKF